MTTPLLYDCDPGNDTAVAIMAAAGHPEIDLLAVTTVAGHSPAEQSAHNASIAVHHAGAAVPVTRGSEKPLVRDQVLAGVVDLERGLDRYRDDLPGVELDPRHSTDAIIETAREHPGLVVVASGPLTNIASALRRSPEIAGNIARVVTLSGAWGLGGKTAAAEFNVWCDPEAASVVYGSGLPLTVLPTDATSTVPVDDSLVGRIAELGTAPAVLAEELLTSLRTTHRPGVFGPTPVPLHDPCAVLCAADPTLGRSVTVRVDVELAGRHTYGRTVIDLGGKSTDAPNADVVIHLDAARVHDALVDSLRRLPAGAAV